MLLMSIAATLPTTMEPVRVGRQTITTMTLKGTQHELQTFAVEGIQDNRIDIDFGVSMSVGAGLLGFGGTSWKEEDLLDDGSKIIVKRSQSYGGRHEIGQSSPVKEHTITFTLPNSGKALSFISEFGKDVGRANFNLLALGQAESGASTKYAN